MIDILYVGNCSIDKVITEKNISESIYCGGSAINSALISSYSNKLLKVGIFSAISKDYSFNFEKHNIDFFGEVKEAQPVIFKINEINNTCVVDGNYQELDSIPSIKTKHLHISFRKGVLAKIILDSNKIEFETLSVDVMIHSIEESKKLIEKYKDRINFIFCNSMEYQFIKDLELNNIQIIITNEDKPIIYVSREYSKVYIIPGITDDEITSKTGAGDSFIGGFLCCYLLTKKIDDSIYYGVAVAQESLRNYGNENLDFELVNKKYDILFEDNNSYIIPKIIIVIGSSCAGKSTFVDAIMNKFPVYSNIDDYSPLKEVFDLDDLLRTNKNINTEVLEEKLVFSKDILKEYKNDFNNIEFYTSPSVNGGHNIDKPILWDLILKYAIQNISSSFNIIQFSRGTDNKYETEFGKEVYQRSIKTILDNLPNNIKNQVLVVNIISNLNIRKNRNEERYKNGGHFVATETMETVYKDDKIMKNILNLPITNIVNNQQLTNVELNSFLICNINRIFENYTSYFKGEK